MARRHLEDDIQKDVAKFLDLTRWRWAHPPNGGYRNKKEAARLVGLGVKPGIPDILIFESVGKPCPCCGRGAPGAAIELKSPTNKKGPTDNQLAWLASLKDRGWLTAVCRSLHEVQQVVKAVRGSPRRIA